ncbi:MAG: acyltransferase family protein [Lachnospiraceae bacterium]|nr:acyltransferase family protein [Lachnospiraceae bacterium]
MRSRSPHHARDAYFDNLKFILMLLVVAGHFLLPLEKTRFTYNIRCLIYAFHMPCFAFVSGYFSKGMYRDRSFRTDRLLQLLWLYLVFKVLAHFTEGLAGGSIGPAIDFFHESGAPWYLLALALWYLTIPAVIELSPAAVLALSLGISLLAGYQNSLDDFLAMDRVIAFAPFFYAGFFAREQDKKRFFCWKPRFVLLGTGILLAAVILLGAYDYLYPYYKIIYGSRYQLLGEGLYPYGALIRFFWYLTASVLSFSLMVLVPKKRYFFTDYGRRTLQIYILHRLLRDLMQYFGFFERINVHSRRSVTVLLLLAVPVVFLLGNPAITAVFDAVQSVPSLLFRAGPCSAREKQE